MSVGGSLLLRLHLRLYFSDFSFYISPMGKNAFPRSHRLVSAKAIGLLFAEGRSLNQFPLRMMWREVETDEAPVRITIAVSKRKFSRAVDRNRIRRLIREAYRLYKGELFDALPANRFFHVALQFNGAELPTHDQISETLRRLFSRWCDQVNTQTPSS